MVISEKGKAAVAFAQVKAMRSVKRTTLTLLEKFIEKSNNYQMIAKDFVPIMMDPILHDYKRNQPDARSLFIF